MIQFNIYSKHHLTVTMIKFKVCNLSMNYLLKNHYAKKRLSILSNYSSLQIRLYPQRSFNDDGPLKSRYDIMTVSGIIPHPP